MTNGKSALITGGAKRIGKAIAVHLAESGFDIALHYNTSKKEALETAREIKGLGQKCLIFKCDFNKISNTLSLIKEVKKSFPSLNLLINNASIFKEGLLTNTDVNQFENHFNINLKTPFFLSRDFAKLCKRGHIINILDTNITRKHSKYFSYNLSKKMLHEFTKMAAVELAPNIRVNAVAPGPILPPPYKDLKYLQKKD